MSMKVLLRNSLIYTIYFGSKVFLKNDGKRIIVFHEIKDVKMFKEKMVWLKEHYDIVPLSVLIEQSPKCKRLLSITFDDGYSCWHEEAAPILEELKVPATFFVCSGLVGLEGEEARCFFRQKLRREQELRPLTKAQLLDLARSPLFEIGSHSRNHIDLGKEINPQTLRYEIDGDRMQLEEWTGKPVRWFAYPFGTRRNISWKARAYVESVGFEGAFTMIPGFIHLSSDRFMLCRDSLDVIYPITLWNAWLHGSYDWLYGIKERFFLTGWVDKRAEEGKQASQTRPAC